MCSRISSRDNVERNLTEVSGESVVWDGEGVGGKRVQTNSSLESEESFRVMDLSCLEKVAISEGVSGGKGVTDETCFGL